MTGDLSRSAIKAELHQIYTDTVVWLIIVLGFVTTIAFESMISGLAITAGFSLIYLGYGFHRVGGESDE